jgi:hypothetical protein
LLKPTHASQNVVFPSAVLHHAVVNHLHPEVRLRNVATHQRQPPQLEETSTANHVNNSFNNNVNSNAVDNNQPTSRHHQQGATDVVAFTHSINHVLLTISNAIIV